VYAFGALMMNRLINREASDHATRAADYLPTQTIALLGADGCRILDAPILSRRS
jgi:hypothetical protein